MNTKSTPLKKTSSLIWLLVFTLLLNSLPSSAQTFTKKGAELYDYYGYYFRQEFKIEVSGLSSIADSTFGLAEVKLNLHHERVSDLKITLESPDGTSIWLTNRNGKDSGANYINTTFSQFGKSGLISAARSPFTGNYRPDGQLEFLNHGQNPNGTWKLYIEDLKKDYTGFLDSIQLSFSNNPAKPIVIKKCDFENIGLCDCASGKQSCELLPDLVIIPFFTENQIQEYAWNDKLYPGQLRLAATIANIGYGPMEIKGTKDWYCGTTKVDGSQTCPDGKTSRLNVNQRIYSKEKGTLTFKDLPAGTMYFENKPGHNHYHVDDWVEFRLVKMEGKKRYIISRGSKVSYCLFTTGILYKSDNFSLINGKQYGENMPNYGLGFYPTCNFDQQGISVGGYDTYGMLYEGQYLNLPKNLKNGDYTLEIEIDPHHWYRESNKKNNVFKMKIHIDKQERQ
ncbi:proprotein convertase P-domain-containing protein [Pedobacter frigidisoli]|uniref:proprotein convertase P-domain-containing protein n=1 Tax=Pedobacter frigidisoli TaxID=2530455 RepID=UPI001981451C|nr:proprotein convertase P-domain-containing protein [Pedobacter frigidisoli]